MASIPSTTGLVLTCGLWMTCNLHCRAGRACSFTDNHPAHFPAHDPSCSPPAQLQEVGEGNSRCSFRSLDARPGSLDLVGGTSRCEIWDLSKDVSGMQSATSAKSI